LTQEPDAFRRGKRSEIIEKVLEALATLPLLLSVSSGPKEKKLAALARIMHGLAA
jgi:hypothetical protein